MSTAGATRAACFDRWLGGELAYRFKIGVIEDAAERPAKTSGIDYAYAGDRPVKRPEP